MIKTFIGGCALLMAVGCSSVSPTHHRESAAIKSPKEPPPGDANPLRPIPGRHAGKYVQVNGIRMYYEIYGAGEPLLLLHGGSASIEGWFDQIPEFSKYFQVIAVDSRGQGRTQDSEKPLSYDLMASDFVGLLNELKISKVSIIGWSDGGVVALDLAMNHPELVKKIVTIGANYRAEGMTEEVKAGVHASGPGDHPAFLVENYKKLTPDGPGHWPTIFGKLKTMWLTSPNYTEADLKKVQCPALILVGDHDIVQPEHSVKLFESIPNAQLFVVPSATHFSPVEKPDLVNGVILQFLKEAPPSSEKH